VIETGSWPIPALFRYLVDVSGLDPGGAHRVLNLGIGMVAFVAPDAVDAFRDAVGEDSWVIGRVEAAAGPASTVLT
jgi:phosphoribosylformylglycinamidine cyclo-ligase/phosphoribosylamine--glycine ligase/phosphoribosylformylglycinamidine cyclo-ligase